MLGPSMSLETLISMWESQLATNSPTSRSRKQASKSKYKLAVSNTFAAWCAFSRRRGRTTTWSKELLRDRVQVTTETTWCSSSTNIFRISSKNSRWRTIQPGPQKVFRKVSLGSQCFQGLMKMWKGFFTFISLSILPGIAGHRTLDLTHALLFGEEPLIFWFENLQSAINALRKEWLSKNSWPLS